MTSLLDFGLSDCMRIDFNRSLTEKERWQEIPTLPVQMCPWTNLNACIVYFLHTAAKPLGKRRQVSLDFTALGLAHVRDVCHHRKGLQDCHICYIAHPGHAMPGIASCTGLELIMS